MLLYAHRAELPDHEPIAEWLDGVVNGEAAYGVTDLVLSGFLRVSTHPGVFRPATPIAEALEFASSLRDRPNRVEVRPGPRHWSIFASLCERAGATGNRIPDAYLAALSIESGSEWITTDRGFARFPGLRLRHPLQG